MKTYKIPALGLEIMAEDTERMEKRGQWTRVPKDLADQGWRYPTDEEFQRIFLPLWALKVLELDLDGQTGYMTVKKDPRWNHSYLHLWTLNNGSPSMHLHRLRLVRDL